MPKPTKGPRMGGSPAHERMMMANLATKLFENGSIVTTEARAKRVQPLAEKLITKARRGDLHARRLAMRTIRDKSVVYELFEVIAPSIDKDRQGGYTRIVKLPNRRGDNAPMAEISLVREPVTKKKSAKKAAPAAAKADEKKAEEAKAEETKAEEVKAEEAEETKVEAEEAKAEEAKAEAADEKADEKAEEKAE